MCTFKVYKHSKYLGAGVYIRNTVYIYCTARKVWICVILPRSIILNKAKVREVKETITQGCSVFV